MKILKNFTEILWIDDQQHETSMQKINEAIFWKILACFSDFSLKKNWIFTNFSLQLMRSQIS